MKNLILVFVMFLSVAASAHNPLAGTKWTLQDQDNKSIFTIDFSSQNQGVIKALKDDCGFNYNASHSTLSIKVGECTTAGDGSGIIPCCDQVSIPFTMTYKSVENLAQLKLTIDSKEYVLTKVD